MQKTLLILLMALTANQSHAQVCNFILARSAPDSRYTLLNNGAEVKDTKTNLIWQRCSLGQTWDNTTCAGEAVGYSWTNALQAANEMQGGWHLPTITELNSLVEQTCYNQSINEVMFPNTASSGHWSSSANAQSASDAWIVLFNSGDFGNGDKSHRYFVRLVRSNEPH